MTIQNITMKDYPFPLKKNKKKKKKIERKF